MLSRKAANTNVIDIGLARPGLEPTIYLTRGEHVTQSTTYAVIFVLATLQFQRYKESLKMLKR